MFATVLVLNLLGSLSVQLFFTISLIGFLVITGLTEPFTTRPAWRSRLRWIIILGLLGFMLIVVRRVLAILPPGVL